jgi:hypothetical protein
MEAPQGDELGKSLTLLTRGTPFGKLEWLCPRMKSLAELSPDCLGVDPEAGSIIVGRNGSLLLGHWPRHIAMFLHRIAASPVGARRHGKVNVNEPALAITVRMAQLILGIERHRRRKRCLRAGPRSTARSHVGHT